MHKFQKRIQQLEEDITRWTDKKNLLQQQLSSHEIYADKNKFAQAETDLKKANDELNRLNKEYEQVFEKIVALEGER